MLVHIFGATSSPCCANKAVHQTADDNEDQFDPEVTRTVCRNFYVDDVLKSVPNEERAIWLAQQLIELMKKGGFHLTKFSSNSRKFLAMLPEKERANPELNLDLDDLPIGRALGLHWDANSDTFQFKVIPTSKPPTKRGILSTVSSLFDPLGFLSPFILPMKVLLQELWRIGLQLDDSIPEPLLTQWRKWTESLSSVSDIKIPRWFRCSFPAAIADIQLHYFSDTSKYGYAAVAYLRFVDDRGRVHCTLVIGKTRNTPLKQWSVPRLDLPKERLIPFEPPFTYTGVDFFGPFHVKRGRSAEKVYGCLFTCFTSRAVHIEDVSSLETDSFIQALRRFISNRGYPKEIWSDNATNFAGAEKEIRQSLRDWNQDELNERLRKDEISCYLCPRMQWKFQPPTASHMSGIWERLIRSVRKTMKAVLGDPNAFVGLETLRTVFAEVVTILNSRPLTPVSDDPSDYEPLTPSHFLLQRQNFALPTGCFEREDL
ncbi:uncharacterized protein [Porites lutea]|uniref:uncharacterized protein n=1 Tax=Porites lutea TaxID=51062 RepID=UPI003CC64E6D